MLKFNTPQEERFFQTLSPQQQAQYIQIQQQQQAEQHIQNELQLESQLNHQLKQQIPQVVNQQNHTNHLQLHSNINSTQPEQLPITSQQPSPTSQVPNQIQNQQLFQSQLTPTQIPQQSFQIHPPSIQQQFPQFASNSTTTYSPSPGVHVTTVHTTIPIQQHSHMNHNHNYDQQQHQQQLQQQQQQQQQQQIVNHALPFLHNIFPSINLNDPQSPPPTIHFFKIGQDGRVIHDDPNVSNQLQTMLQIANPQQQSQLQSQTQQQPQQQHQQTDQPLQLQSHQHQHSFDQTSQEQFQFRQPGKYRDQLTLPQGSDQLIARYARINPFHRNSLYHYYMNNKKLHNQFKPSGISNVYPSNFYYPTQNELETIGWIRDELKTNQIAIENDIDGDINNEFNISSNNDSLTPKQINSGLQLLFPDYQAILSSTTSNPVVSKISSVVSDLFKTNDKNNNNNNNNDNNDDQDDERKAAQLLAEQQYINAITPSYEDEAVYNKQFDVLNQLIEQRQPAHNIVDFNNFLSDLFGIPVSNISVRRYDIHPQQRQQYQHAQNDEEYQMKNATPQRRKQVNPLELLFGIDDDFDHDHVDPFHPHDNHNHSHHRHHPMSPLDLLFGTPGFLHRNHHNQSPQQEMMQYEQSSMNNNEHNHIKRHKHPFDDIFFEDNIFTDPMFNRRRSNQGIQMGLDPMGFRSHHRFGFDDDDADFGFRRDPFASILGDRSPIDSLMMGGLFPHPGQGFNTNDDHPFKNIINNNSSSSSISSFSSSSNLNGGRGGVKSWSSSTVTKVGPDGIARTERQEEEIIDDGSKDGKKHRKIVEKQVRGVDAKRHADIAEVHRVESDLTSGETKVVHKRQLGDKEHERVQEMNVFQGLLEQKENNGQLTNINIKDNVRGLDLNEVNTFDEEFTRALEETTHKNQPIVVDDEKKKKKGLFW